jgi:hypothetical protein
MQALYAAEFDGKIIHQIRGLFAKTLASIKKTLIAFTHKN